ncbi:hypothetical protein CLU79DRAFT_738341 [Phycomyces nitens]|nr:hypothetical protein CLU79DRAFT_738341 [Phycomyces nitens]
MSFSLFGSSSQSTPDNEQVPPTDGSPKQPPPPPKAPRTGLYASLSGLGTPPPPINDPSPLAPNPTPAIAATKPPGWSSFGHFRPVIRKPTIQAKPRLVRPVIPAGARVVSTTVVQKEPRPAADNEPIQAPKPVLSVPPVGPPLAMSSLPYLTSTEDVNGFRTVQPQKKKAKHFGKNNTQQQPIVFDMSEDYDPNRPNDYEHYKEERKQHVEKMKRQKKEMLEKRKHDSRSRSRSSSRSSQDSYSRSRSRSPSRSRSRSPIRKHGNAFAPPASLYQPSRRSPSPVVEQAPISPPATTVPDVNIRMDLNESADDAYMRRARLSQRPPVQSEEEPIPGSSGPSGPSGSLGPSGPSGPSGPGLGSGEGMARKMLAKYGWQEGQGLGRSEDGIREALQVQSTGRGGGVIVNSQPEPKAQPLLNKRQSQVILLTNMVGPGEVDDMLQEETADECAKYGKVERCLIFEVPNGQIADDQAVRIFIKFVQIEAAQRAINDLDGRYFGGRVVSAKFYENERFDRLDLAPTPEEYARNQ